MHIVVASIEKIVPTLEDAAQILRVLARSATGQDMSVYTTLSTGPRRRAIPTGRDEYHVVLLDNGRSAMLGTEFQDMLRCIRCGACMNHCPVYHAVGGHAYGWVYPGPMGAVLTPSLIGVDKAGHLPNASTFCGRCESVCPMRIPLPKMMRHWREREFERGLNPATQRYGLKFWAFLRQAAGALPRRHRRSACRLLSLLRRKQEAVFLPAACRRLDEAPRVAGAGRPDLHAADARHGKTAQQAGRAMSARDAILGKVRASLRMRRPTTARRKVVATGCEKAPTGHHPGARTTGTRKRASNCSAPWPKTLAATVERVAERDDVPEAVARYLRERNLPPSIPHGRRSSALRPCRGANRERSRSSAAPRTATTRSA